ncbi:glutamate synthase large subunit [Rhodococcus chondri]|uniref:Glutamate synthase large subunit n=1 Tax=Rhodococcus chondri TaxID=3065941 RepID=A0ABU7JWA9_9NOCA|nr:glutamate synthase large subunit [Rhodococcus sp. CC-R104]MEE2033809.1 glutamate synthase large subunit [Rhodococcus sp. CC-R104]
MQYTGLPGPYGLYDPARESDACGVAAVVDLRGRARHDIVTDALAALRHLTHRGAAGRDSDSGDGAGITLGVPWPLYDAVVGFPLPPAGHYATGLCFLPRGDAARTAARCRVEALAADEQLEILGWRELPVEPERAGVGECAELCRPHIAQLFVAGPAVAGVRPAGPVLDRLVYPLRRRAEHPAARPGIEVYFPSLSARTVVYKGMLTAEQLPRFYPDLRDPRCASAIALVHSRYSTNTFPSWILAQPFRYSAHNGEINTIRGNRNRMLARQPRLRTCLLGGDLTRLFPICTPGLSDSATVDEVLELLHLAGRSLPHAVTMMLPPAWENDPAIDPRRRAFHRYHAALLEPWDGPACLPFTDGRVFGAVLDRNGLRPGRWWRTREDRVIFASETGVLDLPPDQVAEKGRLEPGRMFLVDTGHGRIVPSGEILDELAGARPYARWLDAEQICLDGARLDDLSAPGTATPRTHRLFGYTEEDLEVILTPMAVSGREPLGSMGSDIPPAVLSPRPRLLYDFVTEMFAQVTNPPLDSIRERLVTTMSHVLGPEANLLAESADACRRPVLHEPVLSPAELVALRDTLARRPRPGLGVTVLPALFAAEGNAGNALADALAALCRAADSAVDAGSGLLIVTDRGAEPGSVPVPSLLAVSALHHHLIGTGRRARTSLIVESGDAREVHHVSALLGFGASAVCPYVAFDTVVALAAEHRLGTTTPVDAVRHYRQALTDGVLEVMAKMGISTLESYIGAQTFDAVGLGADVVDAYLPGTASRIGGVSLDSLARETRSRHRDAFTADPGAPPVLDSGGIYRYRRDAEPHLFTPETVFLLQHATRTARAEVFGRYSAEVDRLAEAGGMLRGLLRVRTGRQQPLPLDDVEPAERIVTRFATGAMSYGSISAEAHEALAVAMNRLGGRSNSGEGGEDRARRGDPLRRSAVKQIASGRFGVTADYLADATDIQIKMAQGAKPGEGGQLPGSKVYPWIARTRCSTPGVGLISPPPHHDIYSIEDLAQLIYDLRCANSHARIHVKLVSGVGVGTVAAGVAKAHADVVLISGHDGGTGAALLTALRHSGLPWEIGLAETQQTLVLNGLRDRITVQCDGGLRTGRDVLIAALLGAEEFGFATAPLVVLGCILMRVCHLDTCPVGVATQNPELRAKFTGRAAHVEQYFRFVAEDVRRRLAALGLSSLDDAIGRADLLDADPAIVHWRARGLDLSPLFVAAVDATGRPPQRRRTRPPVPPPAGTLDDRLLDAAADALAHRRSVRIESAVGNVDRTVGTRLGAAVTARYGADGLPENTIDVCLRGSAGQSLGAFLPPGVTLTVVGDANDYVGKGLSGGVIAVRPDAAARFAAHTQVIAGNTILYGATAGRLFLRGRVGERFAVRNSGAHAVCEGTGDHACEYMTGGRVVILGSTGRNVAAGMSGGLAHVLDLDSARVNTASVHLHEIEPGDLEPLRALLAQHRDRTGSPVAAALLVHWPCAARRFTTIVPIDYHRIRTAARRGEPAVAGAGGG